MSDTTSLQETALTDRFDRQVTYLRMSITDRCNFRCIYCMPAEGIEHKPRRDMLTYEEFEEVARVFARRGVRKIRLTGGEPLVRADVPELVDRLSDIDGIEHVAMTTNAFLLGRHAEELYRAGLTSLNISLDTLCPEHFEEMTRVGSLERVLGGIDAAQRAGFDDIKLNAVVIRGFNDDQLVDLTEFALEREMILRFIEFMPIGQDTVWTKGDDNSCVPAAEIRRRLSEHWDLHPDGDSYGAGPARYWRLHGPDLPADGHPIGIIGAVTECFCADCNRVRITATGGLRACLADDRERSLRAPLRTIADPAERTRALEETIEQALFGKKESHAFDLEGDAVTDKDMTAIGG